MTAREVELTGGAPWGFRMHGGADQNQPLRISRVNPGRKAALSGIREGDIISSINGRPTKGICNGEAHAMIRTAGSVLRLGLNEDRDIMSPRRRSIGKNNDLKRPSHLITEVQTRATPQAPVYATIRPSQLPQNRLSSSPIRNSLNSLPTTLNSTPLVKSVVNEETPRFHPTNPFYTTLPSNYTSASKLPVPNARSSYSGPDLDKTRPLNKLKETTSCNHYVADSKSPFIFSKSYDSGPSSLPHTDINNIENTNGYESVTSKSANVIGNDFKKFSNNISSSIKTGFKNPFQPNIKEDPFEKYLYPESDMNGKLDYATKIISNSKSDSNFQTNDEITQRSTITEHKINEVEEVKTIKRIILNGSGSETECKADENNGATPTRICVNEFNFSQSGSRNNADSSVNQTPKYDRSRFDSNNQELNLSSSNSYQSMREEDVSKSLSAEVSSAVVANKPPLSPSTPALSPTTKPVWRPGAPTPPPAPVSFTGSPGAPPPPPPPPVWTPNSAGASPQPHRKTFRPVHFEESPLSPRKFRSSEQNGCASGSESEGRLRTSLSAPATGLNTLGSTSRLPKAQNPTVTLLQRAREGQIPRGSNYIQQERDSARLPRDRASPPKEVNALRREYASEGEADRSDHDRRGIRKMADGHRKVDGIGPTTKDGMPVALRSEVKDPSRWYKKMYDTIHKNKYDGQPPLRAQSNQSQYAYFDPRSGYLSEPEGGINRLGSSTWGDAYDSDITSGVRRRTASVQEDRRDDTTSTYLPSNKYSTLASARASQEIYKSQPGKIENYVPGKSSVVDKEAKQWWDEVMDIFDGQISSTTSLPQASPKEKKDITSTILSKSNMARALKESGYESDSTLIFRRREDTDTPLSPAERRAAYRDLQAGGEPPLRGFRSPAPPRQDESEIEYIPISSTLTKIRVHKKAPKIHEVICYPITSITSKQRHEYNKQPLINVKRSDKGIEIPPAPPRRVSSKNSRTLKLVTSNRSLSTSPKRSTQVQGVSNVDFLKDKINHKLTRQTTQILTKRGSVSDTKPILTTKRVMSTSAPPAVNRKNTLMPPKTSLKKSSVTLKGTSSFSSPRRTLLPTEYSNTSRKCGEGSVVIEGGAGRKTPISNILDKATCLDKLWSNDRRNERIDLVKAKSKSAARLGNTITNKDTSNVKTVPLGATHKSRDMIRTSEKIQKLKMSCAHASSNPCLAVKNDPKSKPSNLRSSVNISKSFSNLTGTVKKKGQVRTAVVTSLKKKNTETLNLRPRGVPCHQSCSKKFKDNKNIRKGNKTKSITDNVDNNNVESGSQFGGTSNETSQFASCEDLRKNTINSNDIKETRDAVVTNSFFQHLFFGKSKLAPATYPILQANTSVLQKAKMFQTYPQDYTTPKSLNSYLIHRKPVSLSRFKMWDRYPSPTQVQNSRSISWPGHTHGDVRKFDSLLYCNKFGSNSSLATVRSKSEPPVNKIYFTQTSRPKSPNIMYHKIEKPKDSQIKTSISPTRIVFSQTSRPVSPKIVYNKITKSGSPVRFKSPSPTRIIFTETVRPISPIIYKRNLPEIIPQFEDKKPSTMFFSQTSRPVSPKVVKSTAVRSQSVSPISTRSPSYRRIHGARLQSYKQFENTKCNKVIRTRSAGDAEKLIFKEKLSSKYQSDGNLNNNDLDYNEYVRDMQETKVRSERFRELNRYYTILERVGQLEKKTSTSDLLQRRREEDIIDFDRWKKIRAIERAEEELNNLYHKLKRAQKEKDVLFYPRDLKDFRWNYDKDRGLRIKEKSVEDLREVFQQIPCFDSIDMDEIASKDNYKPLWRGTSVAETAFNINRNNENRNDSPNMFLKPKPITTHLQDSTLSELRKKIGLGNRLWSSLSIEQVSVLKDQLNAIYSKELESKSVKEHDKYTVDIKDTKSLSKSTLHVRSNSLISSSTPAQHRELSKSESIAAISCPITSVKELKNNVNKIQMTLSENEKKKISQTLSKEILDKVHKFDSPGTILALHETTPENILVQDQSVNQNKAIISNKSEKSHIKTIIDENKGTVIDENNTNRYVIYPADKLEIPQHSSASETETGSSDVSNKTVIYRGPKREVQKKVEYFESVKKGTQQISTVHHARQISDEKELCDKAVVAAKHDKDENQRNSHNKQIIQSQSCTNIKELFGECEKNKFLSLPLKPDLYSRSPSPHSEVYITDRCTPDTLRYSSDETIWRSRTPSPEPERYWRAYLNLARAGEVRRLARHFDSPTAAGAVLRRHRSDPEITRSVFNNRWLSIEKLSSKREKHKNTLPVAKIPLRYGNRYMPHIDVISKLATLRRRISPRSKSADDTQECRAGEVDRIRRRFEVMSLLGQIYTSAPDVSELRDIAPYLAAPWTAHRFPKRSDNNRSIQDPTCFVRGRTSPVRKEIKQSVIKEPVKLSSILKNDMTLAKQEFDPTVHQPISRYEPPRAPPRPPPAAWPYRLAPYVTPMRHTVKFQETDSAPEPPRRAPHGSYSDTESPRRYVESDVNIHYRCPVRHDPLPLVPERELARQQAEHMKRLYREQRRNKYLQENDILPSDIEAFDASIKELQDMQNRRHQDNFTPSQKTVVPLNRYDDAEKIMARAVYAFNGQTARELSFRKGELIHVRRQIDANWYEGELQGRIGLFPYNYVEILKGEVVQSPKKPVVIEGRARAKFDFTAQTNLELPLKKGEVVVLTRRIDQNWWEGRNGNKTGIFPDSYVTVLQEPSQNKPEPQLIISSDKPAASPAAHGLINGDKRSMGSHSYTPQQNSPALSNAPPATQPLPGYVARPAQVTHTPSDRGYGPPTGAGVDLNNTEPLYVDTNAEAVPYRAMYKYRPQNPDELELNEGDTVYVLEKCDDGWYVGSSQRTGRFGTFPGNYVERI